jgi:hypothetical protein
VGLIVGLDNVKRRRTLYCRESNLGCPARSLSLYQLELSLLTPAKSGENNLMRSTKSEFRRLIQFGLQKVEK